MNQPPTTPDTDRWRLPRAEAERSAYRTAKQAKRLAAQAGRMATNGTVEAQAKVGRIFHGIVHDPASATLATNAELKDTGISVVVESRGTDPAEYIPRDFITLQTIKGEPVSPPQEHPEDRQ